MLGLGVDFPGEGYIVISMTNPTSDIKVSTFKGERFLVQITFENDRDETAFRSFGSFNHETAVEIAHHWDHLDLTQSVIIIDLWESTGEVHMLRD